VFHHAAAAQRLCRCAIVSVSFTLSNDEVVSLIKSEVTIASKAYATPKMIPPFRIAALYLQQKGAEPFNPHRAHALER
jgi:hypothetical protein